MSEWECTRKGLLAQPRPASAGRILAVRAENFGRRWRKGLLPEQASRFGARGCLGICAPVSRIGSESNRVGAAGGFGPLDRKNGQATGESADAHDDMIALRCGERSCYFGVVKMTHLTGDFAGRIIRDQ